MIDKKRKRQLRAEAHKAIMLDGLCKIAKDDEEFVFLVIYALTMISSTIESWNLEEESD